MTVSTPVLILNNGNPTAVYHGPTCRVVTHEHPHEPWMQTTRSPCMASGPAAAVGVGDV
jgi:hypothetical protein